MDRSYKLKMEEKLNANVLTVKYVISCIAKFEDKINELAYKEKQYRNIGYNNFKLDMDNLIIYRQPFIDCLLKNCNMSLDDIKKEVANVKEKNIPTKKVCDKIRKIICLGFYEFE